MVCCLLGLLAPLRAGGATQQVPSRDALPVYRAGVELVVLNVAVLDKEGEPVTDLAAEDFRILQDGRPQEITLFARSEDTPLDVALVLDTSGSIRGSAPNVRQDAMAFVEALGPHDCVYFVPFREYVGPATWAAPDDPLLAARIGGMDLNGGTALYDALYEGLVSVDRSTYASTPRDERAWREMGYDGSDCGVGLPPRALGIAAAVRRTAVVVLSDGGDVHSLATYADTLVTTWSNTVPIFAVAIGDALPPRRTRRLRPGSGASLRFQRRQRYAEALESRLAHLAHISGGRLIMGDERDDVRAAFAAVVTMLRSSYLIGYRPPQDNDVAPRGGLVWHQVEVETAQRNLETFARPGYYRRLVDTPGAEQIVRDSVDLLDDGRPRDAVQQLELAARLDPGYWPIYLQRARALLQMQQPEAARDALLTALALHPGTGSVHELLAQTAYGLGEYELAWQHAIRAHQDNVLVASLLRALQEVSEPPDDLREQLRAARLFVDVGPTPDELDQGTMLDVLRVLRQAVSDAPDVALTTSLNVADAGLVLEVDEVKGSPRKLEGKLVINFAPYQVWEREDLDIDNLDDPASVVRGVARALEKVRKQIAKLR